ncbi:MAG: hypothetical protein SNJ72_11100 [Fimbriimonadales bacterium]
MHVQEWQSSVGGYRFRMQGSPNPLSTPVADPLHGYSFPYLVEGYHEQNRRFQVYATRQNLYPYAERACRTLLHCYELAQTRLGLEHALRYEGVLRVFLKTDGKPGAEQQRNLLYLYALDEHLPPSAWLRELTHEYGHWIIPPINSFVEPEPWANGDLGERWFTRHLAEALRTRQLEPEAVMGATLADLERYLSRAVRPLVERMAREGLNLSRWRSRRRDGYEEYLALALYADTVYGSERFGRAMRIAGGIEPDDFLNGLREGLLEREQIRLSLPLPKTWLYLPGGARRWSVVQPAGIGLQPDPKRPDWLRPTTEALQLTVRRVR